MAESAGAPSNTENPSESNIPTTGERLSAAARTSRAIFFPVDASKAPFMRERSKAKAKQSLPSTEP